MLISRKSPVFLAVLGQVADAGRDRLGRGPGVDAPAHDVDFAARPGPATEDPQRQLRAPGPDQAGQRDDLPAPHLERDVPEPRPDSRRVSGVAQAADLQRDRRVGRGPLVPRPVRIEAAPDHPRDEVPGRHLADQERTLARAVLEHGHAVGDLEDLLEPVRDVDHAELPLAESADHREQRLRLGDRQGGGRLVEDDQPGVDREGLGDLDELLLGRGETLDGRLGVGVQSDSGQQVDATFAAARVDR